MDDGSNPGEQPSRIEVRAFRRDDPDDLAFVLSQAKRIATGSPRWFSAEAIASATQRDLTAAVQNENGAAFVVLAVDEQHNRLGFVYALATDSPFTGAPSVHVSDIVVAAEAEGRGAGHLLLEAAEAWARSRGAATMSLHVFESNTRAQRLYARMGFEGESRRLAKPLQPEQARRPDKS